MAGKSPPPVGPNCLLAAALFMVKSDSAKAYKWQPGGEGDPGDFESGKLKDTFKGYKGVDGDGGTQ
jgi:hypothetical protein